MGYKMNKNEKIGVYMFAMLAASNVGSSSASFVVENAMKIGNKMIERLEDEIEEDGEPWMQNGGSDFKTES